MNSPSTTEIRGKVPQFREAMASVCTPVTVVTTMVGGQPHGCTVSAFSSLSLEPPMIMVALDRGSALLAMLKRSKRFGVNVLSHKHAGIAARFADHARDRFGGLDWNIDCGLPRIADAPVWLACDVTDVFEGGDHLVTLGSVVTAETEPANPLTYHRRTFGTHHALE